MKKIKPLCFSLAVTCSAFAQTYPANENAADTVKLFAADIISNGLSNRDFAISPNGEEIFFTIQQPKFLSSTIVYMHKIKGRWSAPETAPFSGTYRDLEAAFAADGNTIYFSSDRPVDANDSINDFDLWKVQKRNGAWQQPEHLGFTVNTAKDEFYPSVTKNGDLYFTVEAVNGKGREDIVVCAFSNNTYAAPVSMPGTINSEGYEFNAFVDPDARFMLFTAYGRPDDLGKGDLYIAYKDEQGNWLQAKHLPKGINTTDLDYCPFVNRDKNILFFTSNRTSTQFNNGRQKDYAATTQLLSSAGNGLDDLYWIKFDPAAYK